MITVQVYTTLKEKLKTGKIELETLNVADALKKLEKQFGAAFRNELYDGKKLKNYYIFLHNGKAIDHKKVAKEKLKDGDTLHIFPPIAGG
ncbi:MAG: MoaD family protein [Elusimicrobiota bacterium]